MPRRKPEINHGSVGGYVTHRRRKEMACEECAITWRDYYRERRNKLGGQSGNANTED